MDDYQKRHKLILKKFRESLTEEEEMELDRIDRNLNEEVDFTNLENLIKKHERFAKEINDFLDKLENDDENNSS